MDAKTAAAHAGVTADTVRTWARYGAVKATKANGRWDIDTDSLAHRITLSARITAVQMHRGHFVAIGPEAALARALAAGTAVRVVSGTCAGDMLYLGRHTMTYGDNGIIGEVIGLVGHVGQDAAYAIDTARLDGAPALASKIDDYETRIAIAERRRERAEHDYLNPAYE